MPSKPKAPEPAADQADVDPDAPDKAPTEPDPTPEEQASQTTATPETGDTQPPACPPGGHTWKNLVNLDGSPTSSFANQRCTNCGAERRVT